MSSANISSNSNSASVSKEDETVNYVSCNELVAHAWKESCNAYGYKDFSYNEHKKGYLIIAFSGFRKANDFSTESDYGECEINDNNEHFQWMNDGDVDDPKPALVRKVFLDRFLYMQQSTGLRNMNAQAWIGLKSVENKKEKQLKKKEEAAVKLEEMERCMAKIEWYKTSCEGDGQAGYYDCFKAHKTEKDLKANKCRRQLGAFWDHIIELVEKEELPADFQTEKKWISAGTEYRLLVEPLDIAHYYGLGKHGEWGHYVGESRPRRYKFLQKWLQDDKQRRGEREASIRSQPPFVTQDSCFWAYVEEAACSHQNANFSIEDLKGFQERVKKMVDGHQISADVFAEKSSFMMWWNSLKEEDKLTSPLK